MDRRNFLRLFGGGLAAAAAPTKAYSFLGGIYRPRVEHFTLAWTSAGDALSAQQWVLYVRSRGGLDGVGRWLPISDVLGKLWVDP